MTVFERGPVFGIHDGDNDLRSSFVLPELTHEFGSPRCTVSVHSYLDKTSYKVTVNSLCLVVLESPDPL